MKPDPIAEQVHQVREALARRFDGNLQVICEDARRRQSASGRKTVTLPPRRPTSADSRRSKKAG